MMDKRRERDKDRPSVEDYMRMDEKEKDVAIQRAVVRLQNRIAEILYLLESETKNKRGPLRKKDDGKN